MVVAPEEVVALFIIFSSLCSETWRCTLYIYESFVTFRFLGFFRSTVSKLFFYCVIVKTLFKILQLKKQRRMISRFSSWREWRTQRNFRKSKLYESASTGLKISQHTYLLVKRNSWKKRPKSSSLKSVTEGTEYELENLRVMLASLDWYLKENDAALFSIFELQKSHLRKSKASLSKIFLQKV